MEIIDISWPITPDMTGYKDKDVVRFDAVKTFEQHGARVSMIHLDTHTGTHVESASHFLDGQTIDQVSLDNLVGPCTVLDCTGVQEKITESDLRDCGIKNGNIVLLKTKNSTHGPTDPFDYKFVYLDATGAQYLIKHGVKAVGIDYPGLERDQKGHPAHEMLMHKQIPIIEGLRLGHVGPGDYQLFCLPIKIIGLEAAPARAILVR